MPNKRCQKVSAFANLCFYLGFSNLISRQGGPSPRSCHKICIDPISRRIYVLGKYVNAESRASSNLEADFYYYDINQDTWVRISRDVHVSCDAIETPFRHFLTFYTVRRWSGIDL